MRKSDSSPKVRGALSVVYRQPAALRPFEQNARTHSPAQVEQIAASIIEFGFNNPILLKDDEQTVGAGHGRLEAAKLILSRGDSLPTPDGAQVPTITLRGLTEAQWRAYVLADNQLALNAGWDEDLLASELAWLGVENPDLTGLLGFDDDYLDELLNGLPEPQGQAGALAERFGVPPFSVLNARDGWWQDRKRAWLSLGIKSELGRADTPQEDGRRVTPGGGGNLWTAAGAKRPAGYRAGPRRG